MKIKIFLLLLSLVFVSCHFNEAIILNADGSGSMNIELNLDQMMEITQGMSGEENVIKMDTLFFVKDFLEAKKDSIAKLPQKERETLKKMELYKIRVVADSDKNLMRYNLIADFKSVEELDDVTAALGKIGNMAPMSGSGSLQSGNSDSDEVIRVKYNFANNTFKRKGYIKDVALHQQQIDSMQPMEGFFGTSKYALNYTFSKNIKRISNSKAQVSPDKKSLAIEVMFLDYFKNPEVLDLEVEFEN